METINTKKTPIIFTGEQRALITKAASKMGMTFSTYVRERSLRSAMEDLEK